MTSTDRKCERCAGSGEVGIRVQTGTYLAPGPVPDDARGVAPVKCCRCDGSGVIEVDCETIVDSGSWSDLFALAKEIDEHISNNSDLELSTLHLKPRTAQGWWRLLKSVRAALAGMTANEAEIERCTDCGQELPIRYPCHEQGCTIKCRF